MIDAALAQGSANLSTAATLQSSTGTAQTGNPSDTGTLQGKNIIVIGGTGNMASAIIGGLPKGEDGKPTSNITIVGRDASRGEPIAEKMGGRFTTTLAKHGGLSDTGIVENADMIVLAVKPQFMQQECEKLEAVLGNAQPVIVSIAAGTTTESLKTWIGATNIVRVMPNTPSKVGQGISGIYADGGVDTSMVKALMGTVGETVNLDAEDQMHALTGISGSGPAYVFKVLEGIQAQCKLSDEQMREVILATRQGLESSGVLSAETGEDASEFKILMNDVVTATAKRSVELGQPRAPV